MITYLKGDIFSSPAQVLVNTVNTVGVMGKGLALEFKRRYPDMFKKYQSFCDQKKFDIGNLFLWKGEDKWVLLFPTKKHWRNKSKIEYIEKGLQKFVNNFPRLGIESIAFPRLGCGNGGLAWDDVKPVMEKYLGSLPIKVYIYVDNYNECTPEYKQPYEMMQWLHKNFYDISFTMLKEDILKEININNTLNINGKTVTIEWNGDCILISNGDKIELKEDELCEFWNYIRDSGVIKFDNIPERFSRYAEYFLAIMKKLEYLQGVIISQNGVDFENGSNGVQYIKR